MKVTRETGYWICQSIGWGCYFLFGLLMMKIFMPTFNNSLIFNQIVITVVMFLCTHVLRVVVNKRNWFKEENNFKLIGILLVANFLLAILAQVIITPIIVLFSTAKSVADYKPIYSIGYFANTFLIFLVWTSIYAAIKFTRRYKAAEIAKWKAESELQKAEIIALKAQINPHFLFNTLNVVRSLINSDTEKARLSLTKLSNLLRYAINFQGRDFVTLEEELSIVRGYVLLEQIQLEERLHVDWVVDESLLQIKLPAMSVQILVENAIKHGISQQTKGGNVLIHIGKEDGEINIKVSNSGKINSEKLNGHQSLGIQNITNRIKHLLGENALFNLEQISEDKVEAKISWKYESNNN